MLSLDRFVPDGWKSEDEPCLEIADPGVSLESQSEKSDLDRVIQTCPNALPTHYRSALVLADIEKLSYEEASGILWLPLGTFKSRLARARLKMRSLLLRQGSLLPEKYRVEPENIGLSY